MHNESALLQRLTERFATQACLLINPPDAPPAYAGLHIQAVLHDDYANYRRWLPDPHAIESAKPVWFATHCPQHLPTIETAVLFLPKGKQRLQAQLQLLAGRLNPGTQIVLIGAVDAGIKSAHKPLAQIADAISKLDAARHCQAWCGRLKTNLPEVQIDDLLQRWRLPQALGGLIIASLPGIFAAGKLDAGSQWLLESLQQHQSEWQHAQSVLDFGCGSGVLSSWLLQHASIQNLRAVDIDAFALHACQTSLSLQGRIDSRVTLQATAQPADIPGQYELIISNPPFHRGIATSTDATQAFLQRLPELLTPNGQCWLVANAFLGYEKNLGHLGMQWQMLNHNKSFKVLVVRA